MFCVTVVICVWEDILNLVCNTHKKKKGRRTIFTRAIHSHSKWNCGLPRSNDMGYWLAKCHWKCNTTWIMSYFYYFSNWICLVFFFVFFLFFWGILCVLVAFDKNCEIAEKKSQYRKAQSSENKKRQKKTQ